MDERLAREVVDVELPAPDDSLTLEEVEELREPPLDPHLDSAVSAYERTGPAGGGRVGRLVAPDEGSGSDDEAAAVAYDAGMASGGQSAEEAAMHLVVDEEIHDVFAEELTRLRTQQ